ncbi:MAG: cation-efflux pump [Anaerolineae bacterium]|nr:cation-efflux pump [Anaerolineae bacterium]
METTSTEASQPRPVEAGAARYRGVRRVLVVTLAANLLVAAAKLTIGLLTGTLSMVADGVHSTLDGASNVIALVSAFIASRPPDEEHPYGHRRFETLASMFIGGLLMLTAWEIIKSSLGRLSGGEAPEVGAINFVVMIATIGVNIGVTTYESRAGRRLQSEILLADASHTRSDVFVSLTVIASLVAVWLGWTWVDALAALVVVALIARTAWRILRRAADILVDRAALEPDAVAGVVQAVPGVQEVVRVRSRGPGDDIFLDLEVRVAAPTTAEHAAAIATTIRRRLRARFSGLRDVAVHFVPARDGRPDYALIARAEADALGLGVHEVIATKTDGGLILDMHVEVDPAQTVAEAHAVVSLFEEGVRRAVPDP